MASAIALLVISLGAVAAGWGYVKNARRMRVYETTRGRVVGRELAMIVGAGPEGRFGQGGPYWPKLTYEYSVAGVSHTSDKTTYAHRGLKKALAEQRLAATPDEVDVFYDPANPDDAYLEKHTSGLGYALVGGGGFGVLLALVIAVG